MDIDHLLVYPIWVASGEMRRSSRCAAIWSGLAARKAGRHRLKQKQSVRRSQQALARTIGMGHHPQNIASFVQDAGDVAERSIGIGLRRDLSLGGGIAENNAVLALQLSQRFRLAKVVAFHVPD